jgi:DNA polymerase-3 subunit alpha
VKSITARGGPVIDLDALPLDDEATYRMLRSGRTAGVFQFESALATDVLRQMRCDRFDDLVASNALLRPGPLDSGMHLVYIRRKRGEEAVKYALPELEPILEPTYGVITYQEQVMRIAQVLAGVSLAEADVLRKAVGKKDAELIRKELGKFTEKSIARGYDRRIIEDLAGQIETFGRYGFNKSHSVAYSVVSYHTAYLKAHHKAEFMAALLTSCIGDTESVIKYINEARELGLEVLPPDVNESGYKFTVVGDTRIRFGLGAVRNVGRGAIDSMLAARGEGAFTSFFDFVDRVDLRLCNKRVFEALVHAGAFDNLGGHRAQYLAVLDQAVQEAALKQEERESGQGSLFGLDGAGDAASKAAAQLALPNLAPMGEAERLTKEKEILGFYISGHPLEPFRTECELFASHTVSQLGKWQAEPLTLGVVVTAIQRAISKRTGAEYARLRVEDFSGSAEVMVVGEAWSLLADRLRTDVPVLLKGSYGKRAQEDENQTLFVESVQRFEELRTNGQVVVCLEVLLGGGTAPGVMQDVRAVVEAHPGTAPLELRWSDGNGSRARLRSRSLTLAATNAALTELRALLGDGQVRLVRGS